MDELTATLFINLFDSRCGACGKATLPYGTYHADVSGYSSVPGGGCGARFVETATDYRGVSPERLKRVRPDLPVRST